MEERLRRERLLFELIIENTSEGIIVVDNELRHLVWNKAIERINGQPREAVLGKTVFEVFPHFADHPVGHAWRAALKGEHAEIRDYRFFSETRGVEIVYDADFTPLYDQTGAIIGAICILRDTTERHRMEHLSKLETVAQLTGGVAHDFNNLLTAAMGCLEMILQDNQRQRVARLAGTALRAINRGAQLTQQLLAFSAPSGAAPGIGGSQSAGDRNRGAAPPRGRRGDRGRHRRRARAAPLRGRSGAVRGRRDEPRHQRARRAAGGRPRAADHP
jgi:PAS domain S-box-containing protein